MKTSDRKSRTFVVTRLRDDRDDGSSPFFTVTKGNGQPITTHGYPVIASSVLRELESRLAGHVPTVAQVGALRPGESLRVRGPWRTPVRWELTPGGRAVERSSAE
jgi:hypothetical protein